MTAVGTAVVTVPCPAATHFADKLVIARALLQVPVELDTVQPITEMETVQVVPTPYALLGVTV